ncbi:hypothetical protein NKG94_01915 [Micromonospora sp. M12]
MSGSVGGPPIQESYRLRRDAELRLGEDGSLTLRQTRFQLTLEQPGMGRRALLLRLAADWVNDVEVGRLISGLEGRTGCCPRSCCCAGCSPTPGWSAVSRSTIGRCSTWCRPPWVGAVCRRAACTPWGPLPAVPLRRPPARAGHAGGRLTAEHPRRRLRRRRRRRGAGRRRVGRRTRHGGPHARRAAGSRRPGARRVGHRPDPGHRRRVRGGVRRRAVGVLVAGGAAAAPPLPGRPSRFAGGRHLPDAGALRPATAAPPVRRGRAIELPLPDLATIAKADPAFSQVVADRRSVREHDDAAPLSLERLAEFLHRSQHTSAVGEAGGQEVGQRPYPGGGGVYELEIYPLVARCAGLDPGSTTTTRSGTGWSRSPAEDRPPTGCSVRPGGRSPASAAADGPGGHRPGPAADVEVRRDELRHDSQGRGCADPADVPRRHRHGVGAVRPRRRGLQAFAELSGLDPLVEPSVADFLLGSRCATGPAGAGPAMKFRRQALRQLEAPEQLDRAVRLTTVPNWLATTALVIVVVAAGVWSVRTVVPRTVEAAGC